MQAYPPHTTVTEYLHVEADIRCFQHQAEYQIKIFPNIYRLTKPAMMV